MKSWLRRFLKYTFYSVFGTATDLIVLWVMSHLVFEGWYVGEYVISPIISTECQVIVTFFISKRFVWGDRMKGKPMKSILKRFIAFNASFAGVFFIKEGLLLLTERITRLDPVLCDLIALAFSGIVNYLVNNNLIFKADKMKKTHNYNYFWNILFWTLTQLLLWPKLYKKKPLTEPTIIIANHTGHLDGPLVNTVVYPVIIHALAAKDRFEQRGFGWFLRKTNCIPIERRSAATSWVHEAIDVLTIDKDSVVIYPEGRHAPHRQLLPFHRGAVLLAAMANVQVVLIYHDGPAKWLHRNNMIMGEPFRLVPPEDGDINSAYLQKQADMLQAKMEDLKNELIAIIDK